MTPISHWLVDVLPLAPGCPRPTAINAIRQAAIEFCQETNFWRYEMDALITQPGVNLYEMDYPLETIVVSIQELSYNGKPLDEADMDELDQKQPGWRTRGGRPYAYVFRDPNTILLDAVPTQSQQLAGTLALKPSQAAQVVGDVVFEEYREAIAAGALARILAMPKKQWTDVEAAGINRATFVAACSKGRVRAKSAYGRRVRRRSKAQYF